MGKIVNKELRTSTALEKALGEQIQRLLQSISWLEGVTAHHNPAPFQRAFDWLVEFKVPGGPRVELWIDCRAEPRPAHFPYVSIHREFHEKKAKLVRMRVFAAPNLSPRMREICTSHGWGWFDLAGNCRITVPGVIHLERTGNASVHRPAKPGANLGTAEAARVIRTLLLPANAGKRWTQRLIQQHCEPRVSLGLVNKLFRHLRDEAFLESSHGGFLLREPLKLLMAWRDAYRFDQHERHGYFTLLKNWGLVQAVSQVFVKTNGQLLYAGFSAATIQAPNVRQPLTWLYVHTKQIAFFEQAFEAKPVDSGANIMVLIPRDDGVFANPDGGLLEDYPVACTSLPQTYVDLCHSGGRGEEAAEALLNQRLKPAWQAAGLKT